VLIWSKTDGRGRNVGTLVLCSWDSRFEPGPQDGLSWGRLRCVSAFPANSYSSTSLTLCSWLVLALATRVDVTQRWILLTECICACILSKIRSDCFSKQYPCYVILIWMLCFLWGRNWVSKCNAKQIVFRELKWGRIAFFCSFSSSSFRIIVLFDVIYLCSLNPIQSNLGSRTLRVMNSSVCEQIFQTQSVSDDILCLELRTRKCCQETEKRKRIPFQTITFHCLTTFHLHRQLSSIQVR
jgi:hypothetical protein